MSTATELSQQGFTKMRLPSWNEHAYLEVPAEGPWCNLYDIFAGVGSGEPIPILLVNADQHNDWEPIHEPAT